MVRLPQTQARDKAEEYSATLDEVKAKQASLECGHLQGLMLGLVGDPLRTKMAKEATSFLKGVSRSQPSGSHDNHTRRRLSFFPVQRYSFYDWGHIARKDWSRWWPGSVNICVIPFYDLLNIFVCFIRISWFCFSFSLCLNFGPSSEPGVNRGLGSLFWGYASDLFYFSFPFSLCFRPVPPHSPQGYALPRAVSFLGAFLCVLSHRNPLPLLAPCLLRI